MAPELRGNETLRWTRSEVEMRRQIGDPAGVVGRSAIKDLLEHAWCSKQKRAKRRLYAGCGRSSGRTCLAWGVSAVVCCCVSLHLASM